MRIFCLGDAILDWHGNEAVVRKQTIKERLRSSLVVFLVGTVICSASFFASWIWFVLLEIALGGLIVGSLFLNPGKVLVRVINRSFFYAGQQSAPIASLWQRGWNESDSYWTEFGFIDVHGVESTVMYTDEARTSWKYWRELAEGLDLPWEDRTIITPRR